MLRYSVTIAAAIIAGQPPTETRTYEVHEVSAELAAYDAIQMAHRAGLENVEIVTVKTVWG